MLHRFSRTELLIGADGLKKLAESRVAIFGIGGVGGFAAEGLARAGVGKFVLVDDDRVCLTNLNRQIHATEKTIGQKKAELMKRRILEINPDAEAEAVDRFYLPENGEAFFDAAYDYIVDAIDTVAGKIDLAVRANRRGIPIISSMGAGNKLDPTQFEVADLYATSVCPLAKAMRKALRARGVPSLKVVYSRETPIKPAPPADEETCGARAPRRQTPGSVSFVPSVAGLIIAGEVARDLLQIERN